MGRSSTCGGRSSTCGGRPLTCGGLWAHARYSRPGSCRSRATAARKSPPRWPSVARWSAESVAVTTGRGMICALDHPGPLHDLAEADDRDLRRVDDTEDALHALLAQARHRDRRIGELGAPQRAGTGAHHEVAETSHELVQALVIRVVQGGGDETAGSQRDGDADMDRGIRLDFPGDPSCVQLRDLPESERHRFHEEHAGEEAVRHRAASRSRPPTIRWRGPGQSWCRGSSAGSRAWRAPSRPRRSAGAGPGGRGRPEPAPSGCRMGSRAAGRRPVRRPRG